MSPRRDTLTAVDTAATGIGLLAWGVATKNRPVAAVAAATVVAVAATLAAGWWVAAAAVAGAGWLVQIVVAARQPRGPRFADAAAVAIGAVSVVHYVTAINLRSARRFAPLRFAKRREAALCPALRFAPRSGFTPPRPRAGTTRPS